MKLFIVLFATSLIVNLNSQCDINLVKNGSFELDSIGLSSEAIFWNLIKGTPDIDNAFDSISPITLPWEGTVIESNDGGNWQNIILTDFELFVDIESFGQLVELESSVPHQLEFEFTSQKFGPSDDRTWYAAVDVFIDDELAFTTPVDTTRFTWEKHSFTFIPKSKMIEISFSINPELNSSDIEVQKYVAIDGISLCPVEVGMFCDPE